MPGGPNAVDGSDSTLDLARSRDRSGGCDGPLRDTSYEALARFRRQVRQFFAVSEALLDEGGLPPMQYQAMLAIRANPNTAPFTATDLAQELVVKLNTAVELVDRMEAAGMVKRSKDALDRRRTSLTITGQGMRALDHFARLHLEEHRRLLPGLAATVAQLGTELHC